MILPPEPQILKPERFSGDWSKFRAFHTTCQLYFAFQPQAFSLEATKIGFIIALLQGEPQSWAHQLLKKNDTQVQEMSSFFNAMVQLYDDPQPLHALQQGRRAAVIISQFSNVGVWTPNEMTHPCDTNFVRAFLRTSRMSSPGSLYQVPWRP